jgi:endoglucanase
MLVRLALAVAVLAVAAPAARAERVLRPGVRQWVDPDGSAAVAARSLGGADRDVARRLARVPTATWLTGGTPAQVRARAARIVRAAARRRAVPVLVAYDVPGRDCSGYSSGGAASQGAYARWIDGLARGIGKRRAVVILEPDGLAMEPRDCGGTTAQQAARVREIRRAVGRLRNVYLDAGHSAWHPAAEMAARLVAAGVTKADGFFLNVSNFRSDAELIRYGRAVSACLPRCGSRPRTHFVIDTSRNGRGPWTPARTYRDPQDWCNPPGRGLGARPTTHTHTKLLDAKLWIKMPGESDGSCTRGTAGPVDPAWGVVDPPAGAWFPREAAQLVRLSAG